LADIEVLACEAMAGLARFRKMTLRRSKARAVFNPEILEIEKRTNHDVIAFLKMSLAQWELQRADSPGAYVIGRFGHDAGCSVKRVVRHSPG